MFPTIQATVLQKNAANAFICGPCGDYGKVMPIPCGTAAILGAEYWATPQKSPYFQGFRFTISTTAPTADSFRVFKVTNSITSDYYMVMGTIAVSVPLAGGERYVSRVEVDGALVNQQTYGTGSTSIANLVIYLNANAASAGTWSNPDEQTIRLRTTLKKEICFIACVKSA